MLNAEISPADRQTLYDLLYMGYKNVELRETEDGMQVTRAMGKIGEVLVKKHRLSVIKITNSGDLILSIVIIVNDTIAYTGYY